MSRSAAWRLLLACVVIWTTVVGTTACDNDSPTEPTPPPNPNEVFYAALGASDAIGIGGTMPCLPFADCPDGTGYVQVTTRRLRAAGRTVVLTNLGFPSAVLSPDTQSLGLSLGRGTDTNLLTTQLPFVPRNTTLVTVFIGGNDINVFADAVSRGQGGPDPAAYISTQTNNFGRDLRTLINGIRERAPAARIVALNLPNFAGLPFAAPFNPTQKRVIQTVAVGFSAQVNALVSQNAIVLDLMCDARSYTAGNYSADGFHPNDGGYAFMAEMVFAAANAGTAPAPRGSCPQMTLF